MIRICKDLSGDRNMQDSMRLANDNDLAITRLYQRTDGLTISWSDGHESFFHDIWLRDCCYCSACGDSYSSKRYVMPNDIPLDIRMARAVIDAQGDLSIRWQPDGHESRYDPAWLRRNCYDDATREARFHRPGLWDSGIAAEIPSVSFDDASSGGEERLSLYRKLRDFGFVRVTGVASDPGIAESAAGLVGELGGSAYSKVFDLSTSNPIRTMGNTRHAVPPHTDEAFRYTPPGINVLGCVRPAASGGETVLVDGFRIADRLRKENPQAFDRLCRHGQTFNRRHPGQLDQRARQRMIALDDRNEVVGIRVHTRSAGPMDLPTALVKPYYAAYRAFCELMMAPEYQLQFQLQAGEAVLFDNHRVMHARTDFADSRRFLQICNVDRETFHERLRLLAAQLGYFDEANMVLAAGVTN
jgi:gamma-butyrobetaine dioxygenase